jgi:hypothetical protein
LRAVEAESPEGNGVGDAVNRAHTGRRRW